MSEDTHAKTSGQLWTTDRLDYLDVIDNRKTIVVGLNTHRHHLKHPID